MKEIFVIAATLLTASASIMAADGKDDFNSILINSIENSVMILRQDYQLVDDKENEIKNAPNKEYWKRNYFFAAKVGEDGLLITGDALRPWQKDDISKNDRFQPLLSQSALRLAKDPEFEGIDFYSDDASELVSNRLYVMSGMDGPGLSIVGLTGNLSGYAIWASSKDVFSDDADSHSLNYTVTPHKISINPDVNIYDIPTVPIGNVMGGLYMVPIIKQPGCIEFVIAGTIQKVFGKWKLIAIPEGTEIGYSAEIPSVFIDKFISDVDDSIASFVEFTGL